MIVAIPHHGPPHPRVVRSVIRQGYTPTLYATQNRVNHPLSYPVIIQRLFAQPEPFTIIEHDVESRPGFLTDLDACSEPWCFFAYDFSVPYEEAMYGPHGISGPLGEDFAPLGHTRFRPDTCGPLVAELCASPLFLATWVSRDVLVADELVAKGLRPHRHPGKAIHHHDYADRTDYTQVTFPQ